MRKLDEPVPLRVKVAPHLAVTGPGPTTLCNEFSTTPAKSSNRPNETPRLVPENVPLISTTPAGTTTTCGLSLYVFPSMVAVTDPPAGMLKVTTIVTGVRA